MHNKKNKISMIICFILIFSVLINLKYSSDLGSKPAFHLGENVYAASYMEPKISAGTEHSLLLKSDGTVWSWGRNVYGQLGVGDRNNRNTPHQVLILENIVDISTNFSHNLALKNDGTVWAWGKNYFGELGDGTKTRRNTPVQVTDLNDVIEISAGYEHSIALKSDGTVWSWGHNSLGRLGDGTDTDRSTPVQVTDLSDVIEISAGERHSIALKSDGTVWSWGFNFYGQLGDGTDTNRSTPVQVTGLNDVIDIEAGSRHSIALKSDGTIWGWGQNSSYQLGDGTSENRYEPIYVLSEVKSISTGSANTIVIKEDNSVWGWGLNTYGQLGDGTAGSIHNPVEINNMNNAYIIDVGGIHSIILRKDRTVWCAGYNGHGQLGNGTYNDSLILQQVHNLGYLNNKPILSISLGGNINFSENEEFNLINFSGNVLDADVEERISVGYSIIDKNTGISLPSYTNIQVLSYISDGLSRDLSESIIVNSNITEGNYELKVTAKDNWSEITDTEIVNTIEFLVDKTLPVIQSLDVTSNDSSITVQCYANDSLAGLHNQSYQYNIDGTMVTDWISDDIYTFSNLLPNNEYLVEVIVRDKVGNLGSQSMNIYTKPEVPSFNIINPTSYTLDIEVIDNNPATTRYQIINTSNNNYITSTGEETAVPTWIIPINKKLTIKNLTPETTYTYQVKAKNEEGIETVFSTPVSGTTLVPPPGVIPEVTATATSDSITIYWDAIADATGYEVEADGQVINNDINTTFTHTGLLPGTEHIYRVRGINQGVPGEWSVPISKSTLLLPPTTPTNINTLSSSNTVTVTWNGVGNAAAYDVEADGVVVANGNSTNYVHTGLLPNTTHSYRIRAINSAGKSQWSEEVLATTLEENLPVPVNIVINSNKTSVDISWDEIAGMKYQIEVDGNIVDNQYNTFYTHNNLTPDSEHSYRVRSYQSGNYSDWSRVFTVRTKPDTFTTPSNINSLATDTTITIMWDEVTGADGYDIEVDGFVIDNGNNTSFVHNGLQPNSNYIYRIRARQGDVLSDWSNPINVFTYALLTPFNVTASVYETEIVVNWDMVLNAASYEVKFNDTLITGITDTTYTVTGLYPATQHQIMVRAVNENGTSSFSMPITAITKPSNNESPQNIIALASKDQIVLLWEVINGAQSYDIEVGGQIIPQIPTNSYTHSNLDADNSYTYKVRVNKSGLQGQWSNPVTVTTMPLAPGVPENIITSSSIDSVQITWDETPNAEEYEIETNGQVISAGASTNYLFSGLNPNTEYTYRVRAKNQTSVGLWSGVITAQTKSVVQNYVLRGNIGEEKDLILNAVNIKNWNNYTFTLNYNPEEMEIVDICSQTSRKDLSLGNIIGTDIVVTQNIPGTLQFRKISNIPIGQTYNGIINSIRILYKTDIETTITYSIK